MSEHSLQAYDRLMTILSIIPYAVQNVNSIYNNLKHKANSDISHPKAVILYRLVKEPKQELPPWQMTQLIPAP